MSEEDWESEWRRVYRRMAAGMRRAIYWHLVGRLVFRQAGRGWRCLLLRVVNMVRNAFTIIPAPLRLPHLHALLVFICLGLLPAHPLSMPTANGIALVVILYWKAARSIVASCRAAQPAAKNSLEAR